MTSSKLPSHARDAADAARLERALREAEQRFRALVEATAQIVWIAAPSGEFTEEQQSWSAFTGQSAAEQLGWGRLDAVHPDDRARTAEAWAAAVRDGTPFEMERRIRRHDGEYRDMVMRAVPVRDDNGMVREWVGVDADFTKKRQVQRAFLLSEQRLGGIVGSAMDAIVSTDEARRIVVFNAAAERMFGLPAADAVGEIIDRFIPERLRAGHAAKMEEFGRSGTTTRSMHRPGAVLPALRADGSQFFVEASISHARAGGERIYNVILRDVTERLREAEALQRATAEAQEARELAEAASHAKSQFLATMSHELRTPLNAILGYADLLEMDIAGALSDTQRRFVERVRSSGRHLLGLVDEVLDLAKVEAGQLTVERAVASVGPAVRHAATLVRPQAAAKAITLQVPDDGGGGRAHPGDALRYCGDEGRVAQILVNLLSNAVKFTEAGGTVEVSAGRAGTAAAPPSLRAAGGARELVYVRVADTGMGIPADKLESVFEPFVQVDATHRRQHGGTGLGLAISRQLARLMRGDLTLESEVGRGSTFTLWLPAEPALARAAAAGVSARTAVADALARCVDDVIEALTDRLRADPRIPLAREAAQTELENHVAALLADVVQHLAIIDDAPPQREWLIRDGSRIQRLLSDLHGAQRARLGWSEDAVRREFAILRQEVERVAQQALQSRPNGATEAEDLTPLLELFLRDAERVSLDGFRRARTLERAAEGME